MGGEILVQAEGVSKKYCRRLRHAMWYGLCDLARQTLRPSRLPPAAEAVALRRNEFWSLKDISFELHRGECLGVIGPNGAGKSTLLKLISGILRPDEGRLRVRGRVGSLIELGAGFHPMLSGRENIYVNGAILGMSKAEIDRKFEAIVEFAGLGDFLDTPVKFYSSGMYVRLGFAIAAHLEPDVLLVDEVLAVGDVEFQRKCIARLARGLREGKAILLVSHNHSLVAQVCTTLLSLRSGKTSYAGPVHLGLARRDPREACCAEKDLTQGVLERTGPGHYARVTRVSLTRLDGQLATCIRMGEGLRVRLELECLSECPDAEVGVKLSNDWGQGIHLFVSTWEGLQLTLRPGRHVLEVEVPRIELFPGRYLLSTWVLRRPESSDDNVFGALSFDVLAADLTGYGPQFETYATSGSAVYCRSSWRRLGSEGGQA